MKKVISIVLVLAFCLVLMTACGAKETAAAEGSGKVDASDDLYIGVYCYRDLEYFYDHEIGITAVGEMLGVETRYTGPGDGDIDEMISVFESAIAEKPDGIFTFGAEETVGTAINKAEAAGIPVVTVDGDVSSSDRTSFVGTGSHDAGMVGGEKLAEAIGEKGQVAIMTQAEAELHQNRAKGYADALAKYPDIQVVEYGETKSDSTYAIDSAKAILQNYPDLKGIGCTDAVGGAACATACSELGITGVKIISMDRDQSVLESIKKGEIYGTLVQNSALMPVMAVDILYTLKHCNCAVSTDNKKAGVVFAPSTVDTGIVFVDASNCEYFMRNKTK